MIIVSLEQSQKPRAIEVRAVMEDSEFEQLVGNLDDLSVFATKTINEPASAIQTGARHNYAKYLLFPVRLRRQFRADEFDFANTTCGVLNCKDKLYVIYEVPKGGAAVRSDDGGPDEAPPVVGQ